MKMNHQVWGGSPSGGRFPMVSPPSENCKSHMRLSIFFWNILRFKPAKSDLNTDRNTTRIVTQSAQRIPIRHGWPTHASCDWWIHGTRQRDVNKSRERERKFWRAYNWRTADWLASHDDWRSLSRTRRRFLERNAVVYRLLANVMRGFLGDDVIGNSQPSSSQGHSPRHTTPHHAKKLYTQRVHTQGYVCAHPLTSLSRWTGDFATVTGHILSTRIPPGDCLLHL